MPPPAIVIILVCMAVFVVGQLSLVPSIWRMLRTDTVSPVRGVTVGSARRRARLDDLTSPAGTYRGLIWARTPTGIVARAPSEWLLIGHGRQEGENVVIDAVSPFGLVLCYLGFLGALAVGGVLALTAPTPKGALDMKT